MVLTETIFEVSKALLSQRHSFLDGQNRQSPMTSVQVGSRSLLTSVGGGNFQCDKNINNSSKF